MLYKNVAQPASQPASQYSNQPELNTAISRAVLQIESGQIPTDAQKVIKCTATGMLLASATHPEKRFQPGSKLVTYNGISNDGTPIQETYGGGVADIADNSVILKFPLPLNYPSTHEFAGQPVRGRFNDDGTFVVDQQNGADVLFNEYVSDVGFVQGAYGMTATATWQEGFKLLPSYALPVTQDGTIITINKGVEIHLNAGDRALIDTKNGKVVSVHGVEKTFFEKTYADFEAYTERLKNKPKNKVLVDRVAFAKKSGSGVMIPGGNGRVIEVLVEHHSEFSKTDGPKKETYIYTDTVMTRLLGDQTIPRQYYLKKGSEHEGPVRFYNWHNLTGNDYYEALVEMPNGDVLSRPHSSGTWVPDLVAVLSDGSYQFVKLDDKGIPEGFADLPGFPREELVERALEHARYEIEHGVIDADRDAFPLFRSRYTYFLSYLRGVAGGGSWESALDKFWPRDVEQARKNWEGKA